MGKVDEIRRLREQRWAAAGAKAKRLAKAGKGEGSRDRPAEATGLPVAAQRRKARVRSLDQSGANPKGGDVSPDTRQPAAINQHGPSPDQFGRSPGAKGIADVQALQRGMKAIQQFRTPDGKFDRKAYMRDYMKRKRPSRAADKAKGK